MKQKRKFLILGLLLVFSAKFFADSFKFNRVEGETIAVFAPILHDTVPQNDKNWLPDVIQGKLVNAFFTYSTFLPFDQGVTNIAVSQIKESNKNAAYDENTMLEAGKQIQAKYYAYVEVSYLKGSSQYDMTFYVIDIETNRPLCSFSEACTRDQLRVKSGENAIYRAMYKILTHWRLNETPDKYKKVQNWPELKAFVEKR